MVRVGRKDMGQILDLARELELELPTAEGSALSIAASFGMADEDVPE